MSFRLDGKMRFKEGEHDVALKIISRQLPDQVIMEGEVARRIPQVNDLFRRKNWALGVNRFQRVDAAKWRHETNMHLAKKRVEWKTSYMISERQKRHNK